jgi:exopolyphosphatase/guanosine-5'-triphosphate,3'-diphosphate pyrophosphatase
MLYAVIDIGSNAARLLFANATVIDDEIFVEKASLIRIPLRLGKDVFSKGKVSKKRTGDFVKTMMAYKLLIDVYKPRDYRVLATAALREAENAGQIVKKVKKETGLEINIISGRREAEIIKTTNKIDLEDPSIPVVFIDVGGGSTEISVEINGNTVQLRSFKIGTLRYLNNDYADNVCQEIFDWLADIKRKYPKIQCVGSGGNINKINKLYGNSETKVLLVRQLRHSWEQLSELTVEERMSRYGFRRDRADVIVPAAFIYLKILDYLEVDNIIVPKIGLADGMVHILHAEYLNAQSASG